MSRIDFAELRGQSPAVAVVERAVRERTNVLLLGPPATAKTAIAQRITTILPPLADDARRVVAEQVALYVPGRAEAELAHPFRAPHHTIPATWLVGARVAEEPTANMRPCGELQLASYGVLFLDELVEFKPFAIKALGNAWRALPTAVRPLIVASASPCPCGWHGSPARECTCPASSIRRRANRIAWFTALLRMTLVAPVQPLVVCIVLDLPPGESSASIRARLWG